MSGRNELPGADPRYRYVRFGLLDFANQQRVRERYLNRVEHIPDGEYLYPVREDGSLAPAKRWISYERAKDLYESWTVSGVLQS